MAKQSRSTSRVKAPALNASTRVLVLHGKEEVLKRDRLAELRAALEAEHGEIETFTFDGKTATLSDVFDELRAFSLMTRYKIVLVDTAEDFVKAHRDALTRYAENPVGHATLLLRAGTWHKGNLDKAIAKVGAVIKCDEPKPAEAVKWLTDRAQAEHGRTLTRSAAQLLVDRLGAKLGPLDAEVAKLAVMAGEGEPIDDRLVREVVGKGSDEQAWAVQEAVLGAMQRGSAGDAVEAIHELIELSGQPDVLVMYFVADLARKLATAEAMTRQGVPEGQIGRALKLWGPRQQMFWLVSRKLGPGAGHRLFRQALEADARSKSGFGRAARNLEGLCVAMADNR